MRTPLLVGLLLGVAACPPPEPPAAPIPPVSTGKVRVRVFTEPSPVRMLAAAERFVFVATEQDLERFDDGGGVFALTPATGLSGNQVIALGPDPDRKAVWIVTDGGLGRYETQSEVYTSVTDPPASIGLDFTTLAKEGGASIASAKDGGAWIGTAEGLIYVSAKGGWTKTPIKDPIRAVSRDHAGWLWIAATTGMIARRPNGETIRIGPAHGLTIVAPRMLVEMPGDRMLVVGTDEAGHERIAFGKELTWQTYRALPETTWDAATRRGNGAVVMGGGRVYRIGLADPTRVRPLARDGMRLVPVTTGPTTDWEIDPIDLVVPPGATSLGAAADQLLIGTRDLGTARFQISVDGRVQPRDWLRRKQMFQDATTLSVACAKADDCWIATGARQAWRWTGERFLAGGPDEVVLAVVRDPGGTIFALHRAASEAAIHLSKIDRTGAWTSVPGVAIATPGHAPEISFARFASSGALWVGLRYRDGMEQRPFGIATIETATGKVSYHRTGGEPATDKTTRMFPIPIGVVDGDVRGDTAWFATNEGVARLARGQVKVWTEADGLQSELARAVTIAANGTVIVATGAGAGIWDGKAWEFPAALRFELNDVVATRNGQVWMATERGIAAWDGSKVRRVDMRRGLAENQILDVAVDQFDRVWARGAGSLTLISQ
ncbi:MAG: two component regulator propeller domain protein [Myxococcales bacterium]|nr:two component regulator propeller domain protein [Myxococcales bacterium]